MAMPSRARGWAGFSPIPPEALVTNATGKGSAVTVGIGGTHFQSDECRADRPATTISMCVSVRHDVAPRSWAFADERLMIYSRDASSHRGNPRHTPLVFAPPRCRWG